MLSWGAELLKLKEGEPVAYTERLRFADDIPLAINRSWLSDSRFHCDFNKFIPFGAYPKRTNILDLEQPRAAMIYTALHVLAFLALFIWQVVLGHEGSLAAPIG